MQILQKIFLWLALAGSLLALTACGGGSGSTPTPSSSATSSVASSSMQSSSSSSSAESSSSASEPVVGDCGFGGAATLVSPSLVTRIEAENYDTCATSFADTTEGNSGNEYRQDSVDIAATAQQSNGHYVTAISTGEYLEYTVDVEKSGIYNLAYRVQPATDESTAPATFLISSGGSAIEQTRAHIPANANGEWVDVLATQVYLTDGPQTLRLQAITGGTNLDYLELAYTEQLIVNAHSAVSAMGIGINLGNTLDAPSEGAWAPAAQKAYFVAYKEVGFRHVRIPVTWHNHTANTAPYAVNAARMERTEEVVDWALAQGYYVVLNAHHESWLKEQYTQANKDRFDAIWTQIAERFKNKSSKLVFEILNEPVGMTTPQVNELNQRILNIIRATNPTRLVVFAGHDFSGIDTLLAVGIPQGDYLIGNFHSYDPWAFAGQCTRSWGSQQDINELTAIYQSAKNWSAQHDIPVMLNEFGAAHYDFTQPHNVCAQSDRLAYLQAHVNLAIQNGLAASVWDDNGSFGIYKRETDAWGEEKDILVGANPAQE